MSDLEPNAWHRGWRGHSLTPTSKRRADSCAPPWPPDVMLWAVDAVEKQKPNCPNVGLLVCKLSDAACEAERGRSGVPNTRARVRAPMPSSPQHIAHREELRLWHDRQWETNEELAWPPPRDVALAVQDMATEQIEALLDGCTTWEEIQERIQGGKHDRRVYDHAA